MSDRQAGRPRGVAVFDVDLPPGIAFIRSLGRAGVPVTAFSSRPHPAGRYSRYVDEFRRCPPLDRADEFIDWLSNELRESRIDLVAPTSDWIAFYDTDARAVMSPDDEQIVHHASAVRTCLLKSAFDGAMAEAGFSTPRSALPLSVAQALEAAEQIGYPIVLKPRTHVGIGRARGFVIRSPEQLTTTFAPYEIGEGQRRMLLHEEDLAMPMMQQFFDPAAVDVVSVTGCLDLDGGVLALHHARKARQWPPGLGIGTMFESIGSQPFTERAVEAVRSVLGRGIFELEVLVERTGGDPSRCWAIDLNPRAFGQMALDVANGRDLPLLWYRSVTGTRMGEDDPPSERRRYWRLGVPFYTGATVRLALGPDRRQSSRELIRLLRQPTVGATSSWSDPLPGTMFALQSARHPGGLIRPFFTEVT